MDDLPLNEAMETYINFVMNESKKLSPIEQAKRLYELLSIELLSKKVYYELKCNESIIK